MVGVIGTHYHRLLFLQHVFVFISALADVIICLCVCLNRPPSRAVLRQSGLFLLCVSYMKSPVLSSSRPIRNKTR